MKKIVYAAVLSMIMTGCTSVIYESRSNLVTKINDKGIFITTEQYMELIDKKGIDKPTVVSDAIGKFYIPDKYFIVKEDGKIYLNVPNEVKK